MASIILDVVPNQKDVFRDVPSASEEVVQTK